MNKVITFLFIGANLISLAQSYAPAVNQSGTTALKSDSSAFISWATGIEVTRGFINISDTTIELNGSNKVSAGEPENAIGSSNGMTVSLGDSGIAILTFDFPITNGPGFDFAVFENSFTHTFLEL